jgi:hypothetical protein
LDIDLVQDVKEKNKDAPDGFADLVLEEDHKQIVRALVKTHARGPRSTPTKKDDSLPARDIDIVKGKGKGLIILLHGVPGVGKWCLLDFEQCPNISQEKRQRQNVLQLIPIAHYFLSPAVILVERLQRKWKTILNLTLI